jgi:Ca-activated chloride channel homolog
VSFATPLWLLGLAVLPLLLAAYVYSRARARRYAVRFPATQSLRLAAGVVAPWRRHLPAALIIAAVGALLLALAKPSANVAVSVPQGSLILVTDHSGSMQATDVSPDRLTAAKASAHLLIKGLSQGVRVGVVGYSTAADVVQPPTSDHSLALRAIDVQAPDGETATGDALQLALDLLSQQHARAGSAIVLLSDGATNAGRDPVAVAQEAGGRGVPIYTVALGTADGTVPNPDPYAPPAAVPPDPATLGRIATVSGARAFSAQNADQLTSIYHHLGSQFATKYVKHQITEVFAIAGLVMLVAGVGVSQALASRLP